jgi:nucleotide-binding universal stress UspA family protein
LALAPEPPAREHRFMTQSCFKRILVATDGSNSANAAVDLAGSLALECGASIRLVHVWTLEIHHRHSASDAVVRQEAQHVIGEAIGRLVRRGVQASGQLAHADDVHVAAVLGEVARRYEPDLLVVGSRRLSDWESIRERSVSQQLMTGLDCPILIVRSRTSYDGGPIRILLAVAGGDDVLPGAKAAAAAAAAPGSKVLVIHVAWSAMTEHGVSYPEPPDLIHQTVDATLAALSDAGITAEAWLLRPGPVAEVVADAASRWRADLIILGSSRIGDVGSMLFGSVTHDLLRGADLPALVAERA